MVNNGNADIIVYYSENELDYRPKENSIKNEKCADLNNEVGSHVVCRKSVNKLKADTIEFSPAKKGYYIIGILGVNPMENLYHLHWSNSKIKEL